MRSIAATHGCGYLVPSLQDCCFFLPSPQHSIMLRKTLYLLDQRYYIAPACRVESEEWRDQAQTRFCTVLRDTPPSRLAEEANGYQLTVTPLPLVKDAMEHVLHAAALADQPDWTLVQCMLETPEIMKERVDIECDAVVRLCKLFVNPSTKPLPGGSKDKVYRSVHEVFSMGKKHVPIFPVMHDLGKSPLGALMLVQTPEQLQLHTLQCLARDVLLPIDVPEEHLQDEFVLVPNRHVLVPFIMLLRSDLRVVVDFCWPLSDHAVTGVVLGTKPCRDFLVVMYRDCWQQLCQAAWCLIQDVRALQVKPQEHIKLRCLVKPFPEGSILRMAWQRPAPGGAIIGQALGIPEQIYSDSKTLQSYYALHGHQEGKLIAARTDQVARYTLCEMYTQQLQQPSVTKSKDEPKPDDFMTWCSKYMEEQEEKKATSETTAKVV